jgi:hypothetical protein
MKFLRQWQVPPDVLDSERGKGFPLQARESPVQGIDVGTQVTIEVNDTGEVIDIPKDKK